MSEFSMTWELVRERYDKSIQGLSQNQLNFRPYPGILTIGESALHVYGVEVGFHSKLCGVELTAEEERLTRAATDSVVNDLPFPYSAEEITPELVAHWSKIARDKASQIIYDINPEHRKVELKSVLGPMINGDGAFARLAYHPAYHHAQVYMLTCHPEFPRE